MKTYKYDLVVRFTVGEDGKIIPLFTAIGVRPFDPFNIWENIDVSTHRSEITLSFRDLCILQEMVNEGLPS